MEKNVRQQTIEINNGKCTTRKKKETSIKYLTGRSCNSNDIQKLVWEGRELNYIRGKRVPNDESADQLNCSWIRITDQKHSLLGILDLQELRSRIINAFEQINRDMLRRVWEELDYRLDICRITMGEHMEHLQYLEENMPNQKI
ncbi:hypothetical protein C0J52_17437 [Blattella germanica]|nr:hypothetical protein C0J52_17437 [Blattella germanica]